MLRLHPGVVVAAPVLLRRFPVDGPGGTAVEAGQAPDAFGLGPGGTPVKEGDGPAGAELLAEPAADAGVRHHKGPGGAAVGVDGVGRRRLEGRGRPLAAVVVAEPLGPDDPAGLVDGVLRLVEQGLGLLRAGDAEHGHVVVHHGDAEPGGEGQTLLRQQPGHLAGGAAGRLPAGEHQVDVRIPAARQLQLLQKEGHNAGQALEVDGDHKADAGFAACVVAVAAAAHRVPQKDEAVVRGGGDALGGIFAVAGGGKIKDHGGVLSLLFVQSRGGAAEWGKGWS